MVWVFAMIFADGDVVAAQQAAQAAVDLAPLDPALDARDRGRRDAEPAGDVLQFGPLLGYSAASSRCQRSSNAQTSGKPINSCILS